jgi:nicotinate (nicotinamide) nucleotide adenylyltransferase
MEEQKVLALIHPKDVIQQISDQGYPKIQYILKANQGIPVSGEKLGVFSASFNPPTVAHVEMVRRAQQTFHLNEILLLVSPKNADKTHYEATLEERLWMLLQIYGERTEDRGSRIADRFPVSIGVSSHPYFSDMAQAVQSNYPAGTALYFIVGYDTLERILDKDSKYYPRYYKTYQTREESLRDLFTVTQFIVIGRGEYDQDALKKLLERDIASEYLSKIHYLTLPDPYPSISATEVRNRLKYNSSIERLVPPEVKSYLEETGLYSLP